MRRLLYLPVFVATVVISLLGSVPEGFALPISTQFTAEVAYVDDRNSLLGGAINVGDVILGMYTYESSTPDSNVLPTVGDYWSSTAPSGIRLSANGLTFRTDPNNVNFLVEIVNDHFYRDNYLLRSYTNLPLSDTVAVDHIAWQLDDPTATALSSEALPNGPPILADWQSLFGLTIEGHDLNTGDQFYSDERFFVRAHVTNAALLVQVPEPSTLWLVGLGLAGWALINRISRRLSSVRL